MPSKDPPTEALPFWDDQNKLDIGCVAPTRPRACPGGLREVPQPPILPSTRRFVNKAGVKRT